MSTSTHYTCICSYCSKKIRFSKEQHKKRVKCSNCQAIIRLLENHRIDIRKLLSSVWWVKVPKKVFFSETVGPLSESDFVDMYEAGSLNDRCEVKSATHTRDEWILFNDSIMPRIIEDARLKQAEDDRLKKIAARKEKADEFNKARLRKYIQQAVADGKISPEEDSTIESFAKKAKLDIEVVKQIIRNESQQLINKLLSDALEDGILSPDEEEKIVCFSNGLGIRFESNEEIEKSILLSRLAYQLNMKEIDEMCSIDAPFKLQANERCIATTRLEWNEIVQLKRPKGIALGDDRYLKNIVSGNCYLTTKRIAIDGNFESKKATHSSIQKAQINRDGIFLSRSSGKSLFLKFNAIYDVDQLTFALTVKRLLSDMPVQGFLPTEDFIPEQIIEAKLADQANARTEQANNSNSYAPRFTFRVVGDHVGDRAYWINKLRVNEPLKFIREPNNQHDENAVAVCNNMGKQLGYLKRDVAAWFARLLDKGQRYKVAVLRIRSDGCLIVAVYD
jgi:DNA-directed RNA polymerase subunit RPC12/RpoP